MCVAAYFDLSGSIITDGLGFVASDGPGRGINGIGGKEIMNVRLHVIYFTLQLTNLGVVQDTVLLAQTLVELLKVLKRRKKIT